MYSTYVLSLALSILTKVMYNTNSTFNNDEIFEYSSNTGNGFNIWGGDKDPRKSVLVGIISKMRMKNKGNK